MVAKLDDSCIPMDNWTYSWEPLTYNFNLASLEDAFQKDLLRDDKLTYVPLAATTDLITPFALSRLGEQGTVFPLATIRLCSVPVEEGDGNSIDINKLAFCDQVIDAQPKVIDTWQAPFTIVSKGIDFI